MHPLRIEYGQETKLSTKKITEADNAYMHYCICNLYSYLLSRAIIVEK